MIQTSVKAKQQAVLYMIDVPIGIYFYEYQ